MMSKARTPFSRSSVKACRAVHAACLFICSGIFASLPPGHIRFFADETVRQAVLQYVDQHVNFSAPSS
jgi:hypothetical protein